MTENDHNAPPPQPVQETDPALEPTGSPTEDTAHAPDGEPAIASQALEIKEESKIPPDDGGSDDGGRWRLPIGRGSAAAMVLFFLADTVLTHLHKVAGSVTLAAGIGVFHRPLGKLLSNTLVEGWRVLNREAEEMRAARPKGHVDLRPLLVLATAAVSLTLIEYYGGRSTYGDLLRRLWPAVMDHHYYELSTYGYWTFARFAGYVIIPAAVLLFVKGERLRDHGLSFRGFSRHVWIYVVLFLIVLPPVVMVSFTRAFQRTYPFYDLASRSWVDYIAWELIYGLQFFALELFFRGFMLHPLKESMGAYAIFTMAVPYCMIHYHKPLPEVLGAVVAGVVLGTLSMRTGSIWCGVFIHLSVAWSMDFLSLMQKSGLPGRPTVLP